MSALKEQFIVAAKRQAAKVHEIAKLADVPPKVMEIAKHHGLEMQAVAAPDRDFQKLNWKGLAMSFRSGVIEDVLGVSRASYGIAETGSVVFCSSKDHPPSLNFVPEYSVAVILEADIVPATEDVWAALRKQGGVPAAMNIITGPSRTGDIEQTMFFGAHGPRELHIVIVKS